MPQIALPTGATLDYEVVGQGTPLIALHGMLGTGRAHLGNVIDWLSASYQVYAPSLRGYGLSTPKPRDFPDDFYHRDARDVLAFMDALNIEQAHIIGFSDGGEITLICAGLAPERILSAASWGAVGYFGPDIPANFQPEDITPEEIAMHDIDPNVFAPAWMRAIAAIVDQGGDVALTLAPRIACPLLLMLGERDTLNPPRFANTFLRGAAHGRLVMFDAAHPIHADAWEHFQQVLGEFLAAAERGEGGRS
jgi:valacyclovir hydrolase